MRFAECDAAGIAFYPKLIECVHNTVEDWFADAIGFSYRKMHLENEIGVPTRSISVDFEAVARLGDPVTYTLQVITLGRSSISLQVEAHHNDGTRILRATPTLIWCDFGGGDVRSSPIPDDIRERMQEFVIDATSDNEGEGG